MIPSRAHLGEVKSRLAAQQGFCREEDVSNTNVSRAIRCMWIDRPGLRTYICVLIFVRTIFSTLGGPVLCPGQHALLYILIYMPPKTKVHPELKV